MKGKTLVMGLLTVLLAAGAHGDDDRTFTDTEGRAIEGRVEGIWIRVCGPGDGGAPTYRDVRNPSDLVEKQSWK